MSAIPRIGIDAMGGDFGPRAVAEGTALALREMPGRFRVTLVGDEGEIMLISSNGTLVRTPVSDISIMGRNTQGVRLIRVEPGQRLVGLAPIESMDAAE